MNALTRSDGQKVGCLGLGGNSETSPQMVDRAFRVGIDYFFAYSLAFSGMVDGLFSLCRRHRNEIVVAAGDENRDPKAMTLTRDRTLKSLGTDFIDIFYLEYGSPSDSQGEIQAALETVEGWKRDGTIRWVGASAHDRQMAGDLAESGVVDILMHRYNMAHRKSEESVLPRAEAANVPVVAFTCTRWGSLLKGHPQWEGEIPSAPDCYAFSLSHSAVKLALTAPANIAELNQNVETIHQDDLTETDRNTWSRYGDLVYRDGTDSFETRWP